VGPPIISKLNCTYNDQSQVQIPERQTIPDTITDCSIEIHTELKYPFKAQK